MNKDLFQDFLKTLIVEFRQPLTLLMVPLGKLVEDSSLDEAIQKKLAGCYQHAKHLLKIVDQLSNPDELISRYLNINLTHTPLGKELSALIDPILKKENADQPKLVIQQEISEEDESWIDIDKISFVLHFIFSILERNPPKEGPCQIKIHKKPWQKQDSEIFSPKDSMLEGKEFLFLSLSNFPFFYPGELLKKKDELTPYSDEWGMALCKEWTKLHLGDLVFIRDEDQGAHHALELAFCTDRAAYEEREIVGEESEDREISISSNGNGTHSSGTGGKLGLDSEEDGKRGRILVVEDDESVRLLLEELLSSEYVVHTASDGYFGYESAQENLPDLILSDWKMPRMDGVELIEKIRSHEEVSNIPVILLTAYTNIETRIKGLKVGADDYIDKPFHEQELMLRINNILERIRAVQRRFFKDVAMKPEHMQLNKANKEFLKKAIAYVEEHMENSEFRVEDFSSGMYMHKNSLNRKLKNITGLTANAFVRNIRLKNAATMLIEGEDNVSGVSYRVGFVDQRYFSRIFKSHFGLPPKRYVEAYLNGDLDLDNTPPDPLDVD